MVNILCIRMVDLGLKHLLHSLFEKSIVERTIEYLEDSSEEFEDYYPCVKSGLCNFKHVHKWLTCLYSCIILFKSSTNLQELRTRKYLYLNRTALWTA
jgi:hypothetical protein